VGFPCSELIKKISVGREQPEIELIRGKALQKYIRNDILQIYP